VSGGRTGGGSSWFEELEAKLEQQLEAFLRANPAQEALLQAQEQQDQTRQRRERRLALQQQAEGLRAELLELAAEISRWQERVRRAREAGAQELTERAEAHLNRLMEQGRQRWQLLVALGEAFAELEQRKGKGATTGSRDARPTATATASPASEPTHPGDLDRAWARFEADQELEQLRRRQGG